MGVVSGIVMPFQFGTNWSRFSDATANVISPLLAYEGLTAFFLEAAFLGVLLFGRKLVPRWAHFFAALMVAFGTLFSSFWILATNSWMQTPAGYEIDRRALLPEGLARDHLQPVLSLSPRAHRRRLLRHHRLRRGRRRGLSDPQRDASPREGRVMLSMTLWLLTVLVPLQIFLGDCTASTRSSISRPSSPPSRRVGIPRARVPLTLFAIPDQAGRDQSLRDRRAACSAA